MSIVDDKLVYDYDGRQVVLFTNISEYTSSGTVHMFKLQGGQSVILNLEGVGYSYMEKGSNYSTYYSYRFSRLCRYSPLGVELRTVIFNYGKYILTWRDISHHFKSLQVTDARENSVVYYKVVESESNEVTFEKRPGSVFRVIIQGKQKVIFKIALDSIKITEKV